jgi:hypothetical protein
MTSIHIHSYSSIYIHMYSLLMNIHDVMALNTDLAVATHLNINILPLFRLLNYCRRLHEKLIYVLVLV